MAAALAAYLAWGIFPLYFKVMAAIPALEVLGHRIVWSAVLTTLLVVAIGKAPALLGVFQDKKRLAGLAGSAFCITLNWGFFIWAVAHGRALDASIGYFIYPLCSVLVGAVILRERLSPRQIAAVLLVCIGVGVLASGMGGVPWLVLSFPITFVFYGLLRKLVPVDALVGLTVETLLLAPFAAAYLLTRPDGGAFLQMDHGYAALLIAAGPITALPLMMFAYGARRLSMATAGLMQYINPTIQMAVAVLIFGEAFKTTHAITFGFIWAGLVLYSAPHLRGILRKRTNPTHLAAPHEG